MDKSILLFGATGFLGCHLLKGLLSHHYERVYCLVRGSDFAQAAERLETSFQFYFNDSIRFYKNRIIVICGDITQDKFGLSDDGYRQLGNAVDTTIHCAALVKHFAAKDLFESVNIRGTERVLDFSYQYNIYTVLISSIAVTKLDSTSPVNGRFQETNFILRQEDEVNPYAKSKILAEKRFNEKKKLGLQGCVIRVGSLTGRYRDGVFQINMEDNALYSRILAVAQGGIIPQSLETGDIEFTPVDLCSEAVLILLRNRAEGQYHVCNPNTITYRQFSSYLTKLGIPVKYKDICNFNEYLALTKGLVSERRLYTGFYVCFKRNAYQVYGKENLICDYTASILKKHRFEWPEVDVHYIHKILRWAFRQVDVRARTD